METKDPRQFPVARLFIVCADAVFQFSTHPDLRGAYWELHNPIHTVWMPEGIRSNFIVRDLHTYIQLTDGLGDFYFGITIEEVDLANPKRDRIVYRSDTIPFSFENPWIVLQKPVKLSQVPFLRPGLFRFRLASEGREVEGGTAFIRVMPGV
jgi:hypothetical protein